MKGFAWPRWTHVVNAIVAALACTAGFLIGNPASAQITTWEEDIQKAKALEAQHNLLEAEQYYRHALQNFHDVPAAPYGSPVRSYASNASANSAFSSFTSPLPSCNCSEAEKCADTLRALLRVLYAENKFHSALVPCRLLVNYVERNATGPHDPALVAAKANYIKLVQRVESSTRWPTLKPMIKQYKFVGMERTRVHQILGLPDAATHIEAGESRTEHAPVTGSGTFYVSETPSDDMPDPGHRDFYGLSFLMPDPPFAGHKSGMQFTSLDIDYVDDRVVKYRLRSGRQAGRWVSDNNEPSLPDLFSAPITTSGGSFRRF